MRDYCKKWTAKEVEELLDVHLQNLRELETLKADIEGWEECIQLCKDECIEGGIFGQKGDVDMPRGSGLSDPTPRLAARLPEEADIKRCKKRKADLERMIERIEGWLKYLPCRNRRILMLLYEDGMTWPEVVKSYNTNPTDGNPREERTLMRWKTEGINSIVKTVNSIVKTATNI